MLFARDFLKDQTVLRSPAAPARPLVSVVLPTYCRGTNGMLARAISSVLSQTMSDFELLVIDDGSTDGSDDLIEAFRRADPRLIHVRHERNSGIHSVRLNEGMELAKGQFVISQFDDDTWQPNALHVLLAEACRHSEPVVTVGHSHFTGKSGEWVLPAVDLNLVTLYEQNRFANNAVLIPRQLLDQYGMYDCHIGMRRLCDWDLWLRYIKHVPFAVVDDLISNVYESNPGSLGVTVPWDLSLFRYLHDIPREHLLLPASWHSYEVDSLRIGDVEIETEFRRRLYEEQIAPYYAKNRHHFPVLEGFRPTLPYGSQTVLLTKESYDVSTDVTLNHYDALSNRRGNYKAYYCPLSQVGPEWTKEADALLLVRTVEDKAKVLMTQALGENIPVGIYLDDDLLAFHEYGSRYDYLAPGTPYHRNLSEMLGAVDTVWVTTEHLRDEVRMLNPRTIPHSNAIPHAWLPLGVRPRQPGQPLRIGYAGSDYRLAEFRVIWDALLMLSRQYGDQLRFEFWGLDISSLPRLASPVVQWPYTFSYFYYLQRLKEHHFDILLSPLLDHPRPRMAKSLIKYYEAAVAGALGIFSDVPQYRKLPAGLTCLKAENTARAWHETLSMAVAMPAEQFDVIRWRALEHVRQEYTEVGQIDLHEAAWHATGFHARTRAGRHVDGRPRVMYVFHSAHFGGAETVLWRRLWLARHYGMEPIAVLPRALEHTTAAQELIQRLTREHVQVELVEYICFDVPRAPAEFYDEAQRAEVRALLERCAPALVHTVTFIPSFGQICEELRIPHVASLYAVDDAFAWDGARPAFAHCDLAQSDTMRYATRWGDLLGVEKFCARELVPEKVFALGQVRYLAGLGQNSSQVRPLRMVVAGTFQERKSQLEIIEAFGQVRAEGWDARLDFYGYTHFFPAYVQKCERRLRDLHLSEWVSFHAFDEDMARVLEPADIVLSLSTYESLPTVIKEAMAAGVLVVATPVGGIPEVIVDGVSGILCADTTVESMTGGMRRALALKPVERERIVEQARRVARSEFHPSRAASDLLAMYNRAIDLVRAGLPASIQSRIPPQPAVPQALAGVVEFPKDAPATSLPLRRGLRYTLVPGRSDWIGLDIMVGTNRRSADGTLTLRVFAPSGVMLRKVSVDLTHARDNDWVPFRFPPIVNAASTLFVLEFTLSKSSSQTCINIYEKGPPAHKLFQLLHRAGLGWPPRATLFGRLWYAG